MIQQSKKIFFPALVFLFFLSSCNNKSNLLVNTWVLSDMKYETEVPKELQPAFQKSVDEIKRTFRLTYNADGTYVSRTSDQTIKGVWKLNLDSNSTVLTSTPENGEAKDFKVVKLTKDNFTFEADENGSKVILVMIPAE